MLGKITVVYLLDKLALWATRAESTKIVLTKNSPSVLVTTIWT